MLMLIYIRNIYSTIISRVICQIYKSYDVYIHQIKLFVFNEKVKFTPKIEKNMENTLRAIAPKGLDKVRNFLFILIFNRS